MQRWRARKRIKEGEKPGGDFSKAGAADRESNVEHMQTAASSNGGETGEDSGAQQQREKEKKMAAGPEDFDAGLLEREKQREETQERKTPATLAWMKD